MKVMAALLFESPEYGTPFLLQVRRGQNRLTFLQFKGLNCSLTFTLLFTSSDPPESHSTQRPCTNTNEPQQLLTRTHNCLLLPIHFYRHSSNSSQNTNPRFCVAQARMHSTLFSSLTIRTKSVRRPIHSIFPSQPQYHQATLLHPLCSIHQLDGHGHHHPNSTTKSRQSYPDCRRIAAGNKSLGRGGG